MMFIVVHDPRGEWNQGALVETQHARVLEAEGVVLLPIEENLLRCSGVGAFAFRAWGSGLALNNQQPQQIAPMTIYVDPTITQLNWAVRVVPEPSIGVRRYNGVLRLMQDASQPHAPIGGLGGASKAVELSELGAPDAQGGWTLRATYDMSPHAPGHCGISVYGTAPGLRVLWSAISASR